MRRMPVRPGGQAVLVATLVLGIAGTGATQDHPHGDPGHMPVHAHPMMMALMEGPNAALQERERLGLSPDQVQRLEAVRERLHHEHHGPMERMQAAHQELAAAMDGQLDEARARAALHRMGEIHTGMVLTMLRARQETRAILTAEQRARLSETGRAHIEHMHASMETHGTRTGMAGSDMMMVCPMMHGGAGTRGHHR